MYVSNSIKPISKIYFGFCELWIRIFPHIFIRCSGRFVIELLLNHFNRRFPIAIEYLKINDVYHQWNG